MEKSRIILLLCCLIGCLIIFLIGMNIFYKDEPYVDKHIRELKYEAAQINQYENQQIEEKLNGPTDPIGQKEDRQADGQTGEAG